MEIIKATEYWQKAAVHYARIEAMIKGFGVRLDQEFDGHDTEETKYVVALDGQLPVSTCRLFWIDETTAKIERVSTIEPYRNKGIGSRVITEAEKWLKELGAEKIVISSRVEAVRFYERLGYQADWATEEDNGVFVCVDTEKTL